MFFNSRIIPVFMSWWPIFFNSTKLNVFHIKEETKPTCMLHEPSPTGEQKIAICTC